MAASHPELPPAFPSAASLGPCFHLRLKPYLVHTLPSARDQRHREALLLLGALLVQLAGDDPSMREVVGDIWSALQPLLLAKGGAWGQGAVEGRCHLGKKAPALLLPTVLSILSQLRQQWDGATPNPSVQGEEAPPAAKKARVQDAARWIAEQCASRPAAWGPVVCELLRLHSHLLPPRVPLLLLAELAGRLQPERHPALLQDLGAAVWLLRALTWIARSLVASPASSATWAAVLSHCSSLVQQLGTSDLDIQVAEEAGALVGAVARRSFRSRAAAAAYELWSSPPLSHMLRDGSGHCWMNRPGLVELVATTCSPSYDSPGPRGQAPAREALVAAAAASASQLEPCQGSPTLLPVALCALLGGLDSPTFIPNDTPPWHPGYDDLLDWREALPLMGSQEPVEWAQLPGDWAG